MYRDKGNGDDLAQTPITLGFMVAIETTILDSERVIAEVVSQAIMKEFGLRGIDIKSLDVAELGPIDCYNDDELDEEDE